MCEQKKPKQCQSSSTPSFLGEAATPLVLVFVLDFFFEASLFQTTPTGFGIHSGEAAAGGERGGERLEGRALLLAGGSTVLAVTVGLLLLRAAAAEAEAAPLAARVAVFAAAVVGAFSAPPLPLTSLAAAASTSRTERIISLPPSSPTRFSSGLFVEAESATTRERSSACASPRPETAAAVFSPRAFAASLRCEMISGVMTLGGLERSTGGLLLRFPVAALDEEASRA